MDSPSKNIYRVNFLSSITGFHLELLGILYIYSIICGSNILKYQIILLEI